MTLTSKKYSSRNNYSSALQKVLHSVKVLPQTCPNHPNQHLISIAGGEPQCPIEAQHRVDEETSNLSNKLYVKDVQQRYTHHQYYLHHILYNYSLVDDDSIANADFGDFYTNQYTPLMSHVKHQALHEAKLLCHANRPHNIMMSGAAGRGKSHLAMSILKYVNQNADAQLNNHNTSCLFVDLNELLNRIFVAMSNHTDYKIDDYINLISNAYVVVLDDLGIASASKQGQSSFASTVLYRIMNHRQAKRTIFTTNLHSTQLQQLFDSRLYSRIMSGAHHHVIVFSPNIKDVRTARKS